jgi:hypothetical protein
MVPRILILRAALVAAALLALGSGEARAQCTGQPGANQVCAAPSGAAGLPLWRALVLADLPVLPGPTITVDATTITGGTDGRIVYQNAGKFSEFVVGGDCTFTAPTFTCTKAGGVAFVSSAFTDTTNANNISSGTLNNGRLATGFVNAGTGLTGSALAGGGTVAADIATTAQYAAASANKMLAADKVWGAEGTITYGATTTIDFSAFVSNAAVTLTGNITTITFANAKAGQAGLIRFIQDGTGSRTIPATINSTVKCAGGCSYVLSTAASAVDVLGYTCVSATYCIGGTLLKDVK